jgi:nucleotide-binding universal stress UspA family protein
MSATRRFLVAVAGTEDASLPEQTARVVGAGEPAIEVMLFHVSETGPRELATYQPALRRGPWPLPRRDATERHLAEADATEADSLLAAWHERFAAVLPGAEIAHLTATGRPEQEIVAAAARLKVDAVILCPRPRTGPTEPGPRSVGHVARFVVDHSPVPVLLIRRTS